MSQRSERYTLADPEMSNKARKKALSLKVFKQRVGCMLESMTQLSSAERTEAFGFLQNCVNYLGTQKVQISYTEKGPSFVNSSSPSNDHSSPEVDNDDSTSQTSGHSMGKSDAELEEDEEIKVEDEHHKAIESSDKTQLYQNQIDSDSETVEPISKSEMEESEILMQDSKSETPSNDLDQNGTESVSSSTSTELLSCGECGAKLKTRRAMLSHLDRHLSVPVSCRACRKVFNSLLALNFHYDEFCISRKLVCPECDESFSCRTHFTNHMEGHRRNNCLVCPALFTNRKHLVVHMAEVHSVVMLADAAFACTAPGCDRRFVKRPTLHRHMQLRHTTEGQRVCITCGLYLEGQDAYEAHVKTHQLWSCGQCSESFTRRQQYLVHMASHEQSKYHCVTCAQTVPTKNRLLEHRKEGHKVQGLNVDFACDQCDLRFLTAAELREHSAIHKPHGSIKCKFCDELFTTRKACSSHTRSQHPEKGAKESGEGSLICEHCGKQFRQPSLLVKHLKTVHNEQLFSCTFCDHKTNNEVNLRRHLALHTAQEQQYVCDQCGASFQTLSTLKDHNLFVHSDERNFVCEVCKKSFKRKNDLTRHFRSHSDDRTYVCHCKQAYKFMAHLRRHQEAAHKTVAASRKVERLVPDATGKLVQRPRKEKKSVEKDVSLNVVTPDPIEISTCGDDSAAQQLDGSSAGQQSAMQLLTVDDHQVVALSVTDLQISDQQVDPYSIQVAYDGLSFTDSKTQLVYATPGSQVMSLQLPQFELVEPNLSFDANSVINMNTTDTADLSLASSAHPHGPMLMSTPIMSIAGGDHMTQPVMTLITGLEHNTMFTSQAEIGTMTEHSSVYTGGVMEQRPVNGKTSVTYSNTPVIDHKTSQADMSTMTDMYNNVFSTESSMCVTQQEHHELSAMSFSALDPSQSILLSADPTWHISQESVSLPQYSTC